MLKYVRCPLKANPFNTRPLSLQRDTTDLPLREAFVGRGVDSRENIFITNILSNPGGACFVVEGEIGVGKTSFVNYHRSLWEQEAEDKLLTPKQEISVCRTWTLKEFLLNIIGALIERVRQLPSGPEICENDATLQEIYLLCSVHRGQSYQYGLNVLSVGFCVGKDESVNIPTIPEIQIIHYLRYLVEKIKTLGYVGAFIHLDNLELITREQIKETQLLFEDLRDTLQTSFKYLLCSYWLPWFFSRYYFTKGKTKKYFFWKAHLYSSFEQRRSKNGYSATL